MVKHKVETGQSVGSVVGNGKGVVKHKVETGQSVGSVVGQWKGCGQAQGGNRSV